MERNTETSADGAREFMLRNGLEIKYHSPHSVAGMPTTDLLDLYAAHVCQLRDVRITELEALLEESEDLGNRIAEEVDAMVRRAVADKDAEIARLVTACNENGEKMAYWLHQAESADSRIVELVRALQKIAEEDPSVVGRKWARAALAVEKPKA